MARHNFFVFSNCTDPAREEEFNRWYTHTHLPDLSHSYGFAGARRYVNVDPNAKTRYLALYEFDTDDIQASLASIYELAAASWGRRRHIDCIAPAPCAAVATFREIDPATLAPLKPHEHAHYPTEMPEAVRAGFASN